MLVSTLAQYLHVTKVKYYGAGTEFKSDEGLWSLNCENVALEGDL